MSERRDRRRAYERVVGIVKHNTGGPQPALVPKATVRVVANSAGLEREETSNAMQAAIGNGDLLDWHGQLAVVDEASLRAVIEAEVAAENTRKALVGKCNRLLADLNTDGGADD